MFSEQKVKSILESLHPLSPALGFVSQLIIYSSSSNSTTIFCTFLSISSQFHVTCALKFSGTITFSPFLIPFSNPFQYPFLSVFPDFLKSNQTKNLSSPIILMRLSYQTFSIFTFLYILYHPLSSNIYGPPEFFRTSFVLLTILILYLSILFFKLHFLYFLLSHIYHNLK